LAVQVFYKSISWTKVEQNGILSGLNCCNVSYSLLM